jgi:RNA polymerase sigma factor (TIGR02999 family)
MSSEIDGITVLLERIRQGSEEARKDLVAVLYDRFRQRAHRRLQHERPGHSLATTDLTHEALLRLWQNDEFAKAANRHQVFRAFARAMCQLLIDHARRRNADKRGGGRQREELDDLEDAILQQSQLEAQSLDELREALEGLAQNYPREAQVLEMHTFSSLTLAEIAEALSVSPSTVARHARFARAWLRDFLSPKSRS